MIRFGISILIIFSVLVSNCQVLDSTYSIFEKTKSYKEITTFLVEEGHQIEYELGKAVVVFKNIVSNENYLEKDIGIWKIGLMVEPSKYYLLFKVNNSFRFSSHEFENVLREFNRFIKKACYTENQKNLALFGIVKYLNECNGYPIECFMDCY
jgi:hypothetical protein